MYPTTPITYHLSFLKVMIVPESVDKFFRGSDGTNVMASPNFLIQHTGSSRLYLPAYDIYHGGRDTNGEVVYTIYRILGKESVHNTIQGILEIRILDGYGIKKPDDGQVSAFMRPNDVKKMVTEGSTSIKRNSVITLSSGLLVRLEDVENFCDLPIIDRSRLFESQTHLAVTKREAYKVVRGTDNWAHVKRGALARDMERSIHKLLLPYYRKYRSEGGIDVVFRNFMEDLLMVCKAHHANFTENGDFVSLVEEVMTKKTKRKMPSLLNETRPRKRWGGVSTREVEESPENGVVVKQEVEDKVKMALKNVSRSKIASIVF